MSYVWVKLSDDEKSWLESVVEAGKPKDGTLSAERWVFKALRQLAADYNRTLLRLESVGLDLDLPATSKRAEVSKQLTPDDLDYVRFQAPRTLTDGAALQVRFPESMLEKLEHGAALDDKLADLQGPPAIRYKDFNDWVRRQAIDRLIKAKADVDAKEMDELEKATFKEPEPKPDAPKSS
jgi:hypothetical protein